VRLIGVGLGYTSLHKFMQLQAWMGELFVDESKDVYAALNLSRGGFSNLFTKTSVVGLLRAKARGTGGSLQGDALQMGGTFAIDQGGKVLLEFREEKFGDYPKREDILISLGLEHEIPRLPAVGRVIKKKGSTALAQNKA